MEVLEIIKKEIDGVLEQVKEEEIQRMMDEISKERRIFTAGEGRSGLSVKGFAMRLMHLGYTVYAVGETITPALREGDVFIAVSGSGESVNVVNDAKKAQAKGCRIVVVTSKPESSLAQLADTMLVIPGTVRGDTAGERGSVQLLSSLFDQCLHITLDAVCLLLSQRDRTANDLATKAHW